MGYESALRELRARSLKDLPVGDKEARSLLARQALLFETQDTSVLGDPETMLTAAQVLSAALARPGDVFRKDSVDITGLHAVAQLHPQQADDGPAVATWLYGGLTDDGRGPIDPSRAAAALHGAVHELRDRHLSQPVVWAPLVHVGR